jgi:hypothetical protein
VSKGCYNVFSLALGCVVYLVLFRVVSMLQCPTMEHESAYWISACCITWTIGQEWEGQALS